nr:VWA domain-containing protein [Phytohabitans rumicis]
MLGMLRDTTEVAVWEFAADLEGGRDFREVLPLVPLFEQRGDVFAALNALRTVLGAQTGLYDTTLAAYRQARGLWKPGRLNLVLIATDGYDNDPYGIGLGELVDKLDNLQDPARPLPIIFIGIGTDVDVPALEAISDTTGGRTFLTRDGAGIRKVFFEALDFLIKTAAPPR